MGGNRRVLVFACAAGGITLVFAGRMLYSTLSHDRWEVFHAADCVKRLDDADQIKKSDPLAAYRIYEAVLAEAAQHQLTDASFKERFFMAAKEKDSLYLLAEPIIREQEEQRKRLAEKKRLEAEAREKRIAEENRRRAEQEAREKRLIATVRERLRFYESTDGYIPRAGRQTLDALKKLEARVQVEVTYDQYRDLCGQTWGDIRVFVESEKGEKVKEFSDALTKAIEQYKVALEAWRAKLDETSAAQRLVLEEALQESWREASRAVRLASNLQDDRTREAALRDYYGEKDEQLASTKTKRDLPTSAGPIGDLATRAPVGKGIDLLPLVDPKRDHRSGEWTSDASGLLSPQTEGASLDIPFVPPHAYVLTVAVERIRGDDAFAIDLIAGDAAPRVIIDGWSGTISGFHGVDGKEANANETTLIQQAPLLAPGHRHTVRCAVAGAHITVQCDGKTIIDWHGDSSRLPQVANLEPGVGKRLRLRSHLTQWRISAMELLPTINAGAVLQVKTQLHDLAPGFKPYRFARYDGQAFSVGIGPEPLGVGYGIVGYEIESVQPIVLNVFVLGELQSYDANSFAGFFIDYHTSAGYSHRVALSLGLSSPKRGDPAPLWGKAAVPDRIVDLPGAKTLQLFPADWSPSDWDGRIWLSVVIQNSGKNTGIEGRVVSW